MPSMRGSAAAPTRDGSSPSSFANVCALRIPKVAEASSVVERPMGRAMKKGTYTPFTTGVHDAISKYQTTTLADEVAAAEFL